MYDLALNIIGYGLCIWATRQSWAIFRAKKKHGFFVRRDLFLKGGIASRNYALTFFGILLSQRSLARGDIYSFDQQWVDVCFQILILIVIALAFGNLMLAALASSSWPKLLTSANERVGAAPVILLAITPALLIWIGSIFPIQVPATLLRGVQFGGLQEFDEEGGYFLLDPEIPTSLIQVYWAILTAVCSRFIATRSSPEVWKRSQSRGIADYEDVLGVVESIQSGIRSEGADFVDLPTRSSESFKEFKHAVIYPMQDHAMRLREASLGNAPAHLGKSIQKLERRYCRSISDFIYLDCSSLWEYGSRDLIGQELVDLTTTYRDRILDLITKLEVDSSNLRPDTRTNNNLRRFASFMKAREAWIEDYSAHLTVSAFGDELDRVKLTRLAQETASRGRLKSAFFVSFFGSISALLSLDLLIAGCETVFQFSTGNSNLEMETILGVVR